MRALYADMSPGNAWDGREPEVLEAATATQVTTRTASLLAAGVAALASIPRPLAFLVGGSTPAHAPATATITGTDIDDNALTEVVALPTTSAGQRCAGAICSRNAFKTASVTYSAGSGIAATVAIGFGLIPGVADLRMISIEDWLEGFGDKHRRRGYLDPIKIDEIVMVGSSFVDEGVGEPHGNYPVPFILPPPTGVARIARDRCLAEAGKLRPAVFAVDHAQLLKDATRERELLKKAHTGTGASPPDPASNTGGAVYPSLAYASNKPKFNGTNKWGIF
jgi:hypothetical protein